MTEKEKDKFLDDLFSKETVREKMIRELNDPYHNPFSEGSIASEQFDLAMQVRSGHYESGNHETDYYLQQYYGSDYEDTYGMDFEDDQYDYAEYCNYNLGN
jgi:hypothetical protein|tara:strand:+ start:170 stop:472 length:303 start_codon:yes stop_codon:yes gene_type:complete